MPHQSRFAIGVRLPRCQSAAITKNGSENTIRSAISVTGSRT